MATIQELESFKMSDAVKFHKELNPELWENHKLDPEVRDQLLLIAEDFVEFLGIGNLKVKDVTISGSNAAYSYTPHSDLDLHVLVDFNELPNNEVYQELFTAKKTLYNDAHDISVHGVPVELYVQDTNNPVQSLGEYSIVHDKWIRIPKKRRANYDEAATKAKYEKLGDLIELALKSKDPKRVDDTTKLIKRYRKSGLDKHGEFGPENLAYKAVRKQGLVQALYDLKAQLHGEKLSIEEEHNLLNKPTLSVAEIAEKHGVTKMQIAQQLDKGIKVELEHTKDKSVAREIALDHLAEDPKYYDKLAKVDLEEQAQTFAGKDPMSFKSPKGGTPTMLLMTAQGSRYLITSDGMVLRNKSAHASTGGEDQGLKDWSDVIEYYDPTEKPGGTPFALSVSKAIEKKLPVALSNTKDGKRALMIYANGAWKVARISDIYKVVASTDDPIVATYSTTPKLNWNVLDYDIGPNKLITRAHPGSPVTHGVRLGAVNEETLTETAHESQLVNLISKSAAKEIFKMLRKKESTLAKVIAPDIKRQKLETWGISAEKLGVPYVNDPVLGSVLRHAKFRVVDYIDPFHPKRIASYDDRTHEITVHYPAIVRDASDTGYETQQLLAKIIAHELQHAVDNFKSRGKAFDTKKTSYPTLPYEINARFQEALYNMTMEFDEARKAGKKLNRKDLPKFIEGSLDHNRISEFLPKDGKRYKQLAKRAYKFFDAEFNNPKKETPLSFGKRAINYILGKPTATVNESVMYHVTPTRNLRSIMKNGLHPQVGDRSAKIHGEESGIFLFPSLDDVEAAVSSWLGDEFDEDEDLSLLAIDASGLPVSDSGAGYEKIVKGAISPDRISVSNELMLEASGYIPSAKEKNDPRFKTALTVDVKPDSIKKNAKAFNWKTSRAGIPPQANPNGKIAEDLMKEWKSFLAEDQEQQELFPGYDEKHRQERLNAWLGKSHAMVGKKPKVLYHATTKHFDQFRGQNKGFASALGMTFEVDRTGIFLAENPKFAAEYIEDEYGAYKKDSVIIPVYLSAQYPFSLTDDSLSPMLNDEETVEEFKENGIDLRSIYNYVYEFERWELFDGEDGAEFVANLKKLGYDSAVMYESSNHLGRNTVWVAFDPSQVKAITNRGSFSPDDPRLMKENG